MKLTEPDYALNFVCPYFDLYEECMWYIDRQPMGRTHPKDYRGHGPLSVMPDAANGHTAVVSNFNAEQSDLMLQLAVQGPGEDLSLEGTEVKCSCQPRGEPGPTRETKTVIGESGTHAQWVMSPVVWPAAIVSQASLYC